MDKFNLSSDSSDDSVYRINDEVYGEHPGLIEDIWGNYNGYINLKLRKAFTVEEMIDALDIYEQSAIELLDGVIPIKHSELEELADYKSMTVDDLFAMIL